MDDCVQQKHQLHVEAVTVFSVQDAYLADEIPRRILSAHLLVTY